MLVEVAESFRNFQVVAKREAEQRTELGAGSDVTVTVPYFDDDITDLAGLARLGATLWEPAGLTSVAAGARSTVQPRRANRSATKNVGALK